MMAKFLLNIIFMAELKFAKLIFVTED